MFNKNSPKLKIDYFNYSINITYINKQYRSKPIWFGLIITVDHIIKKNKKKSKKETKIIS